jgi:hypothetical protein
MTEGKEFIGYFLDDNGFEFCEQEMIEGLTNDSKQHRVAETLL